jgi:hypothetical protein
MGFASFVGEGGTHRHLVWVRHTREFGRVERLRRIMWDRMIAVVNKRHGSDDWPEGLSRQVIDRITAAQDRVFPFPSYEDCEGLPWPVWIEEPLACQTCGTVSTQKGHIEGATIGRCGSCPGGLPYLGSSRKDSA